MEKIGRRTFAAKTAAAAAGAVFMAGAARAADANAALATKGKPFKCKFAANFYMNCPAETKGMKNVDKVRFFYDWGFRAIEDNDMMRRPVEEQKAIAKVMEQLGMEMGVYTSYSGFTDMYMTGNRPDYKTPADKKAALERTRKMMTEAMEVGKRVNAKWTTIAPGLADFTIENGYQFANVADHLKAAAEVCAQNNMIAVVEPLSPRHPGHWLLKVSDAYALCKAVNSPSCKILYDVYHQQYSAGNLFKNIDAAWDEIAYFHFGDMPERTEPGSGEINFKNLVRRLWDKGYRGLMGMEHYQSDKTINGDMQMIQAYREIDVS